MKLNEAIRKILDKHKESLFISTDGYISRELYKQKKENIFPMVGSMGLVSAIGLGIALNTNKEVVVLNGDGGFLMGINTQFLINHINPSNLVHYILDNNSYGSTGGQKCIPVPELNNCFRLKIDKYDDGDKPPRISDLKTIKENFMRCKNDTN